MHLLDELFEPGHYIRIANRPAPNVVGLMLWDAGPSYTSFTAEWVPSAAGCATPKSTRIRVWTHPQPNGPPPGKRAADPQGG
jgi:hypothetical protein